MKNLLVISNSFPQGDRYNNICVKWYTDLIKDKFDNIYIICPTPYFPKPLRKFWLFENYSRFSNFCNYSYDNINIYYPEYFTLPLKYFRDKSYKIRLKLIKKTVEEYNLKFDIIHCHFVPNQMLCAKLKQEFKDAKIIMHCHDSSLKEKIHNESYVYSYVFSNIDESISFCEHYDVINKFLKENKIETKNVYIPNFVDTKKFYPKENVKELRKKYWFNQKDKILISVWNLVFEHKWQNDILWIWEDLNRNIKDLHLIIVWEWPDKEKLLNLIKNLNTKRIHYIWGKNNDELVDYYNISDLFVFPSRHESFWIVQIESIACGTPVIAYKNWWSEYIIKDRNVWTILWNQDTNLLNEWIIKMLNKEYNRKYLHNYIEKNYSQNIVKKELIELYNELCNYK